MAAIPEVRTVGYQCPAAAIRAIWSPATRNRYQGVVLFFPFFPLRLIKHQAAEHKVWVARSFPAIK
jgi:hypothetical protein